MIFGPDLSNLLEDTHTHTPWSTTITPACHCVAPRAKLVTAKRLWGMFFALDNAAEYGHWVVDDKAA